MTDVYEVRYMDHWEVLRSAERGNYLAQRIAIQSRGPTAIDHIKRIIAEFSYKGAYNAIADYLAIDHGTARAIIDQYR